MPMHSIDANGARIPCLGMGTWTLSGEACSDLVAHALSIGYRHVDTAGGYRNEAEVGAGIRASGVARDEVFVTTKIWHTHLQYDDFLRTAEASIERLGIGPVDLLLIHWPNPAVPLAETIAALNAARGNGLTRHIGVSNFPTGLLAQARALSAAPLVADQVEHHPMLDQTKVLAACRAAGMAMVSYCPLFRGGGLFETPAVADAARRHGKTPGQVVLRWQVQQPGVAAIPRTSRKERLAENLDIFDFALSEAEMAAISALQAANRRLCDFAFSPEWDEPA
mgnify:CR=1 FL=1